MLLPKPRYQHSLLTIISSLGFSPMWFLVVSLAYNMHFLNPDIDNARNVKWLLSCFDGLSGMKINFDKCDLLTVNLEGGISKVLAPFFFCCKQSFFPLKYLGVPLHFNKLSRDLQPIIDRIIKRICRCRGELLSYEAKLVILHTCIASIPMYLMSIIKFPKWAIKAITSQMAQFL